MVRGGGRCKYDEDDLTDGDEEEQPYTEEYGEEEAEYDEDNPGHSPPSFGDQRSSLHANGCVTIQRENASAAFPAGKSSRPTTEATSATSAAKRAAAAEARATLKRRGVISAVETIADHVVIQMAQELKRNEQCVKSEQLRRAMEVRLAEAAANARAAAVEKRKLEEALMWTLNKPDVDDEPDVSSQEDDMNGLVGMMASNRGRSMLTYIGRNIVHVPPSIVTLTSLTSLDFTRCYLATLPPFGDLRLRRLYLSWNQFQVFPQTLLTATLVSSIEVLDFTHNELTMLPDELGHMTELRMMLFDHNRLDSLPPMSKLVRLEVLRVEHNKIRLLPTELVHLSSLVRLSTSGNDLLNVPSGVTDGPSVKRYLRAHASGQLHVPPGKLVDDLRWLCSSAPDGGADVHLVLDAGVVPIHSAVLQGRLPRLLANSQPAMMKPTEEGCYSILLKGVDLPAMRTTVALAVGSFQRPQQRDADHEAAVSALVHAHGSAQLIQDWAALDAGTIVIVERSLANDLGASFTQLRSTSPPLVNKAVGDMVTLRVQCAANEETVDDTTAECSTQTREVVLVAHRGLLARRCPFFHRQLASGMADAAFEDDASEAHVSTNVTFDVFESMLRYLYTDSDDVVVPDNAASLMLLASEYELPRLGNIAEMLLGKHMDEQNAAQVLQLAHLAGARALKRTCVLYMSGREASRRTASFQQLTPALQRLCEA